MENKTKYLVVDLDNTLLKIDLFKEELGKVILKNPIKSIKIFFTLFSSKVKAKNIIANQANIDWDKIPYNHEVFDLIMDYRKKGYKIIMATGAPKSFAYAIANNLGFFDKVIATEKGQNNIGKNKLSVMENELNGGYIYVGDSNKDIPIWLHCKKAILVGSNRAIENKLKIAGVEIIDSIAPKKSFIKTLIKSVRVHQWSKNILLFVPAFANHQIFSYGVLVNAIHGFIAFSLLASSIYVFNDIVDIDNDRAHPKKKTRPIASGDLSIFQAYSVMTVCFLLGGVLSYFLGVIFIFIASLYVILNLLYSFKLKKIIILDVILLMTFYALRLIAGHVPDNIPLSPWLLSFSFFLFFSLGLLKRYIDTIVVRENNNTLIRGRAYTIVDGGMLMSLGVGSGLISALVLILYTGSDQVQIFYSSPMVLVVLAPVMLYWISRMWLLTERGEIKSDPVLFAIKDKVSIMTLVIAILVFIIANIEL